MAPRDGSFSPGELQPGPLSTTGARWPGASDGLGNQCATIGVPSNDGTTRSSACALAGDATQRTATTPMHRQSLTARSVLHAAEPGAACTG